MQRMMVMVMIAMILMLSIFIQTKANDLAHAPSSAPGPQSENGLLPAPIDCLSDVKTIPNCVSDVLHFRFKEVTDTCCTILLGLSDDCFGLLFPIPYVHPLLMAACRKT
ncbi:hypothetical protein V5N11_010090 [Cardamine amara subsp. amara]|uniref:Prolamin-like domain-containing protein n=1 Tax=Cardamine amara subsp. amara TaxID=228776 RepID=A0ABD0ZS76_CARAN